MRNRGSAGAGTRYPRVVRSRPAVTRFAETFGKTTGRRVLAEASIVRFGKHGAIGPGDSGGGAARSVEADGVLQNSRGDVEDDSHPVRIAAGVYGGGWNDGAGGDVAR